MIKNTKRTWDIFSLFRKYYCPKCKHSMKLVKCSKVVNDKSDEAAKLDFSSAGGEGYVYGDVKFIWDELRCGYCGLQLTVNDYKNLSTPY